MTKCASVLQQYHMLYSLYITPWSNAKNLNQGEQRGGHRGQ